MAEKNGFFGFSFKKSKKKRKESFVAPINDDGALDVGVSGFFAAAVNSKSDTAASENELIRQYRTIAIVPEVDQAIEDIINEAIIADGTTGQTVSISITDSDYSEKISELINEEFEVILKLLNFNAQGHEIFRNWYIDGRIYYHKLIDISSSKKGLVELRPINPTEIKKVREIIKELDPQTRVEVIKDIIEYYVYNNGQNEISISPDSICYETSGVIDRNNAMVLSHLHKAIRPANQLKMTENAQVIYRLARAPERRIFYIDVGNMPKTKAEQHLKEIMDRYRNKMVYDAKTGTLTNSSDEMNMMEDFWLPRREGGKGTEITTLPGGSNLADIDDLIYFQKKLFKSLNVPVSRLDSESTYTFGSGSEVTRDEVKFAKFISKLRNKFTGIFDDLLRTQLILKGVITEVEWDKLKENITYNFQEDNYYAELKDSEILKERISTLELLEPYIGKYYSNDYVRKTVLKQTDEEIKDINDKIKEEEKDPIYQEPEEDEDNY
jgi:hypothetical protein